MLYSTTCKLATFSLRAAISRSFSLIVWHSWSNRRWFSAYHCSLRWRSFTSSCVRIEQRITSCPSLCFSPLLPQYSPLPMYSLPSSLPSLLSHPPSSPPFIPLSLSAFLILSPLVPPPHFLPPHPSLTLCVSLKTCTSSFLTITATFCSASLLCCFSSLTSPS